MNSARLLLAAGLLALTAGAAQARIVTVTWTGLVTDGVDVDGSFGDQGADLAGFGFTAVYRFDTARTATDATASSTDIQGGSRYATTSPVLSASITINGHTFTLAGSYFGEIYSHFDGSEDFYTEAQDSADVDLWNSLRSHGPAFAWATPDFADFDSDVSDYDDGGGFSTQADLFDLANQHLTIHSEADGAVPEPAGWALMLGGFGLVGGALRRRRTTIRFA
jgi:hypothetical protein